LCGAPPRGSAVADAFDHAVFFVKQTLLHRLKLRQTGG